jgi:hypothetical protein
LVQVGSRVSCVEAAYPEASSAKGSGFGHVCRVVRTVEAASVGARRGGEGALERSGRKAEAGSAPRGGSLRAASE